MGIGKELPLCLIRLNFCQEWINEPVSAKTKFKNIERMNSKNLDIFPNTSVSYPKSIPPTVNMKHHVTKPNPQNEQEQYIYKPLFSHQETAKKLFIKKKSTSKSSKQIEESNRRGSELDRVHEIQRNKIRKKLEKIMSDMQSLTQEVRILLFFI